MSQPDCLFCGLVANGDHVRSADGFVAVRDIAPKAPVHLLVIPERHVPTFRDVGEFGAEESLRMLEFVADTAREAGLEDYRVDRERRRRRAAADRSSTCTGMWLSGWTDREDGE